eukprot:CAMPEP_0206430194 /NCGR_PEP_ID=MMETSP0324_2-20121206/6682_1 /ASSEMBLY_ACC=CAM_ASM_000836 /TAXON_ID=2866 /ORGANISM="Crypthecodinium cohnii, Strain Seligo" /LENGTH=287 /DNA_ID=CAMNT_0053896001 /DNA_START=298 /DNA_END=1163 /DNA_ORIENTATION=+
MHFAFPLWWQSAQSLSALWEPCLAATQAANARQTACVSLPGSSTEARTAATRCCLAASKPLRTAGNAAAEQPAARIPARVVRDSETTVNHAAIRRRRKARPKNTVTAQARALLFRPAVGDAVEAEAGTFSSAWIGWRKPCDGACVREATGSLATPLVPRTLGPSQHYQDAILGNTMFGLRHNVVWPKFVLASIGATIGTGCTAFATAAHVPLALARALVLIAPTCSSAAVARATDTRSAACAAAGSAGGAASADVGGAAAGPAVIQVCLTGSICWGIRETEVVETDG